MHAPLCSHYLPLDCHNVPTGEVASVSETCFDFREDREIAASTPKCGFDQYFVTDDYKYLDRRVDRQVVQVISTPDANGNSIRLRVFTNMPGFQFYTANGFDSSADDEQFKKHGSFAIEPSEFIDAANHEHFPSISLAPGKSRQQRIEYKFSVITQE